MFLQGLLLLSVVYSASSAFVYTNEALQDQVTKLPGLFDVLSYNQFSGYIQLPGTQKDSQRYRSSGNPIGRRVDLLQTGYIASLDHYSFQ